MTTTNISICNEALNLCGAKSIQSFDENTENARRCAVLYDSTRKSLLRMHPWSCAKTCGFSSIYNTSNVWL